MMRYRKTDKSAKTFVKTGTRNQLWNDIQSP